MLNLKRDLILKYQPNTDFFEGHVSNSTYFKIPTKK